MCHVLAIMNKTTKLYLSNVLTYLVAMSSSFALGPTFSYRIPLPSAVWEMPPGVLGTR
jgi:hypothetical protein